MSARIVLHSAVQDGIGAESLSAHGGVSFQSADDGVQEFGIQVGRIGELFFAVIDGLPKNR